jgi:hypothetical protein
VAYGAEAIATRLIKRPGQDATIFGCAQRRTAAQPALFHFLAATPPFVLRFTHGERVACIRQNLTAE